MADCPLEACGKAILLARGEIIDKHWFFVDERGFRDGGYEQYGSCNTDTMATKTIPIKNILMTMGDDDIENEIADDW